MSASLQSVIGQIHAQAQRLASPAKVISSGEISERRQPERFSDALLNSINEINQTQLTAKTQSQQWMSGSSDIGLNDVMLSMQKSSVALSFGVQVRNKMLSAYQEVMNMPA